LGVAFTGVVSVLGWVGRPITRQTLKWVTFILVTAFRLAKPVFSTRGMVISKVKAMDFPTWTGRDRGMITTARSEQAMSGNTAVNYVFG
jgi:hypothetical protein